MKEGDNPNRRPRDRARGGADRRTADGHRGLRLARVARTKLRGRGGPNHGGTGRRRRHGRSRRPLRLHDARHADRARRAPVSRLHELAEAIRASRRVAVCGRRQRLRSAPSAPRRTERNCGGSFVADRGRVAGECRLGDGYRPWAWRLGDRRRRQRRRNDRGVGGSESTRRPSGGDHIARVRDRSFAVISGHAADESRIAIAQCDDQRPSGFCCVRIASLAFRHTRSRRSSVWASRSAGRQRQRHLECTRSCSC